MNSKQSLTVFDIQTVLSLINVIDYPLDDQLVIDSISRDGQSYSLFGHLSDGDGTVMYHFVFGKNIEGERVLHQKEFVSNISYTITELLSSKEESILLLLENGKAKSFIQTNERLYLDYQFPHHFHVVPVDDIETLYYQKKKSK